MTLWLKRLTARLGDYPQNGGASDVVANAIFANSALTITYHTGFRERWYLIAEIGKNYLDRSQADLGVPIHPHRQYELPPIQSPTSQGATSQDDSYAHHLTLPRYLLKQATPVARAVAIQRFVLAMMRAGYKSTQHPTVLRTDLCALIEAAQAPPNSVWDRRCLPTTGRWRGQLRCFPFRVKYPGRALQRHFYDLDGYAAKYGLPPNHVTLSESYRRPRRLTTAVKRVLLTKFPVTTMTVTSALHAGPVLHSPMAYLALLRQFKLKGIVHDLHPDLGHKALACAALGLPYLGEVPSGLAQAVGLRKGDGEAEVIIADSCFRRTLSLPRQEPSWYTARGGMKPLVCLFMPAELQGEKPPIWLGKPRWRLRVAIDPLRRDPDYFLLYRA